MSGPAQPQSGDQTAWPSLLHDANNNSLYLNDFIAYQCAQYCEQLIGSLLGAKNAIVADNMNQLPPIGTLDSGSQLAQAFNSKVSQLDDRIDMHVKILTDMGNTFIAAGEAYHQAELDSADNFNISLLQNFKVNNGASKFTITPVPETIPTWVGNPPLPPGVGNSGVTMDPLAIELENPDSLSWNDLYRLGQGVNPQAVANLAGMWAGLANGLTSVYDNFGTQMGNTLTPSNWSGDGASAAQQAVTTYYGDTKNFTREMSLFGDAINYTSGWLQQTQSAMPNTAQPPSGPAGGPPYDAGPALGVYRQNFANVYGEGLSQTSANVPLLTNPTALTGASGPSGASGPGASGPGSTGPGSTGPGAGASGPGGNGPGGNGPGASGPGSAPGSGSSPGAGPANGPSSPSSLASMPNFGSGSPAASSPSVSAPSMPSFGSGSPAESAASVPAPSMASIPSMPTDSGGGPGVPSVASPLTGAGSQIDPNSLVSPSVSSPTASPLSSLSGLTGLAGLANPASSLAGLTGLGNIAGLPNTAQLANLANQEKSALNAAKTEAGKLLGGGGGGAGGGGPLGAESGAEEALAKEAGDSKLFPRASAPVAEEETTVGRAGMAEEAGMPMSGMPMGGMGGAGAGQGQQEKDRKRASYLDSVENLDEGLGDHPIAVRPVLDR